MGIVFKKNQAPKLEETVKSMGSTTYRQIRECTFKKEAGVNDDKCDKIWKDLGINEAE